MRGADGADGTDEADLLIVGAGVAGWCAATRAIELGGRVRLVEKAHVGPSGGNGMLSGAIVHAAYLSPTRPPDVIYDAVMAKTDGRGRPDVVRSFADNVGRVFRLLDRWGGRFQAFGPHEFQAHQAAPPDPVEHTPGDAAFWTGNLSGAVRLLSELHDRCLDGGAELHLGSRAVELVVEGTRVVGVVAQTPEGRRTLRAGSVLICDGGFSATPELVHRHITEPYVVRGSANDSGDGLRMGTAIGAQTAELQAFYGFVLVRDAISDERFRRLRHPAPQPLRLIHAAVVVDGHGRRIADEAPADVPYAFIDEPMAGAIARSETPGDCWVVFDRVAWETAGRQGRPDGLDVPMNPGLVEQGGTLVHAGSLPGLAAATGLPESALVATIDAFNRYCRDGTPVRPQRSGNPSPIAAPPFYAVPLVAAVTFTMGGLLVDADARVLGPNDRPIAGLYAAGGVMGGLQGGPHNGYVGGWSEASTFGVLAAEHAVGRG